MVKLPNVQFAISEPQKFTSGLKQKALMLASFFLATLIFTSCSKENVNLSLNQSGRSTKLGLSDPNGTGAAHNQSCTDVLNLITNNEDSVDFFKKSDEEKISVGYNYLISYYKNGGKISTSDTAAVCNSLREQHWYLVNRDSDYYMDSSMSKMNVSARFQNFALRIRSLENVGNIIDSLDKLDTEFSGTMVNANENRIVSDAIAVGRYSNDYWNTIGSGSWPNTPSYPNLPGTCSWWSRFKDWLNGPTKTQWICLGDITGAITGGISGIGGGLAGVGLGAATGAVGGSIVSWLIII